MIWREYHEATKHTQESLRRSRHTLDWANMPDPFRHYDGVPVLDLPANPVGPGGSAFLSELLFHSAAISASKRVPSTGYKYALRVNPSSGNLHPTEFHFATRGLIEWPDGLYHYRPSSHMVEQRALGHFAEASIVFVLTSIAWREEWKYRDRAYRYCLHDIGHAWQALALAATAMGCASFTQARFEDDDISKSWRLPEDEWPMLLVTLEGPAIPVRPAEESARVWLGGHPNRLSEETLPCPRIDRMHSATKLLSPLRDAERAVIGIGEIKLPAPEISHRSFRDIARMRRSALDFKGGTRTISLAQLSAILAAGSAEVRFVQLYLYLHRVDGLEPGVYRHWPESATLELMRRGDQRVIAAGLSLSQDLAGNACVAFSMIADLERATRAHGDRGYRYAHFEAGAIGHRMYLAAEGVGLAATGIGAFLDDEVHRYLGLTPGQGQVIYHFAIGYPVHDARLDA